MTRPISLTSGQLTTIPTQPRPSPWTARNANRRDLRTIRTRRYELSWLLPNGDVDQITRVAPAMRAFEHAVSALRQGTLLMTPMGPRAIEDLMPGDMVETEEHGPDRVLWIGAMSVLPQSGSLEGEDAPLTRINADSFGIGRPGPDLVLGRGARLLHRSASCVDLFGVEAAFAPATAFIDGETMVGLRPQSPVRVYHLAFAKHRVIRANGVEIESFHPGNFAQLRMERDLLGYYLSLFPHISTLDGFGPSAFPQLSPEDVELLKAA